MPALRNVEWNHMITRLYSGHTLSDTLDHTPSFMTKDTREESLRIMTIESIRISVTDTSGTNLFINTILFID